MTFTRPKTSLVFALLLSAHASCAQQQKPAQKAKNETTINMEKLTHPVVKSALEAWQKGDSKTWLSFFTADAKLYDDGNPRDFHQFSSGAIGHERFTSIDKVENKGLDVYGKFHSDQWGDFKTYFKFTIDADGKITRLDIGQANY